LPGFVPTVPFPTRDYNRCVFSLFSPLFPAFAYAHVLSNCSDFQVMGLMSLETSLMSHPKLLPTRAVSWHLTGFLQRVFFEPFPYFGASPSHPIFVFLAFFLFPPSSHTDADCSRCSVGLVLGVLRPFTFPLANGAFP